MRPSTPILGLLGICTCLTVALPQVLPARDTATAEPAAPGEVIALYMSGRVATEHVDQTTDAWTGELVSLATGEVTGTLRHEISCRDATSFPCVVFDSTDTFTLAEGTIVAEGTESIAPYANAAPGLFHVGIHPEGNSIVSTTGIYAGRSGRAQLMARHDGREYPGHVTFDDVWLIRLDP